MGVSQPRPRPWQVWLVELDKHPVGHEQGGIRPSIVVSTEFYATHARTMSLVIPMTSRDRVLPWQPRVSILTPSGKPGVALVEQMRSISHSRLLRQDDRELSTDDVASIKFVMSQLIDFA